MRLIDERIKDAVESSRVARRGFREEPDCMADFILTLQPITNFNNTLIVLYLI